MKAIELETRIESLKAELAQVEAMTDAEVCEAYNTDSKQDIVEDIRFELAYTAEDYEEVLAEYEYEY